MSSAFIVDGSLLCPEQEENVRGQNAEVRAWGCPLPRISSLMGGTITCRASWGKDILYRGAGLTPKDKGKMPVPKQYDGILKVPDDDDRDSCVHTALLLENLESGRLGPTGKCMNRVRLAHRSGRI